MLYISMDLFRDYCESDPLAVIESALGAPDKDVFLSRLFKPFAMANGETLEGFEFESDEIPSMIKDFLENVRESAVFLTAEKYYTLDECGGGHLVDDRKFILRVFGRTYEIDREVDDILELSEYIGRIYGGTKVLTRDEFYEAFSESSV